MNEDVKLEEMKNDFHSLYQKSEYKETLLRNEIEGYKLIFDNDGLPLSGFSKKDKPLREYEILYSSQQIFLIREFHRHYNVRNNDISKMYKGDWDSWTQHVYNSAWGDYLEPNLLVEPHGPKYYILLAEKLYKYLKWLEGYPVQKGEMIIKEKKDNKPDTAIWAYYFHILHQVDSSKSFNLDPDGKINAIKKVAKEKGISYKNLEMHYNNLNESKPSEIMTRRKIPIIQKVIELFKDNPEGLKLANEYLNKVKL
jgi:hypothetical protein